MIAIIDYGVGNLFSLKSSFASLGIEAEVTADPERIEKAEKLRAQGLWDFVIEQAKSGKPFLGICLGMQLLLDESFEFGRHQGLGLVPGKVVPIANVIPKDLKIPQMGWNALKMTNASPIFSDTAEGEHMYFVHSFYCDSPAENVTAVCEYGALLTAAVQNGNVFGTQFHPEKSGPAGLRILKAFSKL